MKIASFSIGKLAKIAGVSTVTLRYYEKIGLLKAGRSSNGYRCFAEDALQTIDFVKNAKTAGFSLTEIIYLHSLQVNIQADSSHVKSVIHKKILEIKEKIKALHEISDVLNHLDTLCDGKVKAKNCPILKTLSSNK